MRSYKENVGFREGIQRGNFGSGAVEAPQIKINNFVKRSDKEKVGFREGAHRGKSGYGGSTASNQHFC